MTTSTGRRPVEDKSVAELMQQLSAQTSELVREELALARVEMKEKGKQAGLGVGLFGGAGVLAHYAGGALVATIVLGLAEVLDAWLAALIVTAVLFVVAGMLGLVGRSRLRRATPMAPEQAIRSTKSSVETVKGRVRH